MGHGPDIAFASIILVLGLFGFMTGAIVSMFYVASGFIGMLVAQRCAASFHISFFLCFLVVTIALVALGYLLRSMAHLVLLGIPDRIGGFFMGIALAVFLLSLFYEPLLSRCSTATKAQIRASYFATRIVPVVRSYIPYRKGFSFGGDRLGMAPPPRDLEKVIRGD